MKYFFRKLSFVVRLNSLLPYWFCNFFALVDESPTKFEALLVVKEPSFRVVDIVINDSGFENL